MAAPNPAQIQEFLNGPALAPPSGITPNFINPASLRPYSILAESLGLSLASILIALRFCTKRFVIRRIDWEDYICLLGWVMYLGFSVPSILSIYNGAGVHQWNVQVKHFFSLLYYINLQEIIYGPAIFVIKLSILLQYLRIFVPVRSANMTMYICTHIVIWCNFVFYFIDTFIVIFACTPRKMIWNKLLTRGHCLNNNSSIVATGAFNVISDFAILALPMGCIWKLNLPRSRKLGLCVVFATGFLACITSVVRLYYSIKLTRSVDVAYRVTFIGYWTIAEVAMGIICSCLPIMPKLIQHLRVKASAKFSSFDSGSYVGGVSLRSLFKRSKSSQTASVASKGNTLDGSWDLGRHHSLPNQTRGEYYTLEDRETALPKHKDVNNEVNSKPIHLELTTHEDFEARQTRNNIVRTVRVETHRQARDASTVDLEGQQPQDWR